MFQRELILPFYKQTFRNKPTFYFVHVSIAKFVVSKVKPRKFLFFNLKSQLAYFDL